MSPLVVVGLVAVCGLAVTVAICGLHDPAMPSLKMRTRKPWPGAAVIIAQPCGCYRRSRVIRQVRGLSISRTTKVHRCAAHGGSDQADIARWEEELRK